MLDVLRREHSLSVSSIVKERGDNRRGEGARGYKKGEVESARSRR